MNSVVVEQPRAVVIADGQERELRAFLIEHGIVVAAPIHKTIAVNAHGPVVDPRIVVGYELYQNGEYVGSLHRPGQYGPDWTLIVLKRAVR